MNSGKSLPPPKNNKRNIKEVYQKPLAMSVPYEQVVVAPLVLLSVLDHHKRTSTPDNKRCLGVILGDSSSSTVRINNCFALPFEEEEKNPDVWFLDHNYIENMNEMCKKINAKEKLIGWYHSGGKLKASDLKINELFKKYSSNNNPVLLVVNVKEEDFGLPTNAYVSVEQIKDDGTSTEKTFIHLPSSVEAEEAEEIGVEHLLKDVRDQAAAGLSIKLTNQLNSLKGLQRKLGDIVQYLDKIAKKELPVNHIILGKLQDIFNLLPNLGGPDKDEMSGSSQTIDIIQNNLEKALTVKTNDELMIIYISNLVRAIVAFDNLIENKIENKKLAEKSKEQDKPVEAESEKADQVTVQN